MRSNAAATLVSSLALVVFVPLGCKSEAPQPIRVADQDPIIEPRIRPERTGPFRNPNVDAPTPRAGTQLAPEELAAARKQARDHFTAGKPDLAITSLQRCANRVPQSVECEAELAMLLLRTQKQRAVANYYLDEACRARPATAPTSQYRQMGTVALERARYEAARSGLAVVVEREEATVDDYVNYGRALRRDRERLRDAVDAYGKAYALDPTRNALLDDQAKLLERLGDRTAAAAMLRRYIEGGNFEGNDATVLQQRLAELELPSDASKSAAQ